MAQQITAEPTAQLDGTIPADVQFDEITPAERARYNEYFAANMPQLNALLPGGLVGRRNHG